MSYWLTEDNNVESVYDEYSDSEQVLEDETENEDKPDTKEDTKEDEEECIEESPSNVTEPSLN